MRARIAAGGARGRGPHPPSDKPENVRFYERFGFEPVGQEPVIGVPNWFMRREPRAALAAGS
jgi:hypothetical protein